MRKRYTNWSCAIFPGFYETIIGNPILEEDDLEMPEGFYFEISNWDQYAKEIGKEWVAAMYEQLLEDDLVYDLDFIEISSPKYYNFETDKLVISVCYRKELISYCKDSEEFGEYLKENFSDRDGFISFIPNNKKEFFHRMENGDDRTIDVMIEFWLLKNLDFEQVLESVLERQYEIALNLKCLESDKDFKQYDYEIVDGYKVNVLGEIK